MNTPRRSPQNSTDGFSLVEMLVVALILSLTLGVFSIATIYLDTIGVFRDAESS